MRKLLVLALLVLVGTILPNAATALDCQYHNLKLDFKSATEIDPIDPYFECLELSKVAGTLNGSYIVCWFDEDFVASDDVFQLHPDGLDIYAVKYYSWIETKN